MKHTDFYKLYKKLDEQARKELVAAVKAHGNEYVFIHTDEDGAYDEDDKDNAPIILASTHHMSNYEDFCVVSVSLNDNDALSIYGFAKEGFSEDEHELCYIAHGHLEYLIDSIPETEDVKDVSIPMSES